MKTQPCLLLELPPHLLPAKDTRLLQRRCRRTSLMQMTLDSRSHHPGRHLMEPRANQHSGRLPFKVKQRLSQAKHQPHFDMDARCNHSINSLLPCNIKQMFRQSQHRRHFDLQVRCNRSIKSRLALYAGNLAPRRARSNIKKRSAWTLGVKSVTHTVPVISSRLHADLVNGLHHQRPRRLLVTKRPRRFLPSRLLMPSHAYLT